MKRYQKGDYGYISYQKRFTIIKTIILYLTAVLIFYIGYHGTGKRENLFTVIAILDILPASRSLVSMIMYLRIPRFREDIYSKISEAVTNSDLIVLYNLYLTSEKNNFALESVAVRGNSVIGLADAKNCDFNLCQTHILDYAKQNGLKNITVKLFEDENKYLERLTSLKNLESSNKDEDITNLIKDLSL